MQLKTESTLERPRSIESVAPENCAGAVASFVTPIAALTPERN